MYAFRRARNFKSITNRNGLKVFFTDDSLKLFTGEIFILDESFDFIMTSNTIYILHPAYFAEIAKLKEKIMQAASQKVDKVSEELQFLDLERIKTRVSKKSRSAKLIASITTRGDHKLLSKDKMLILANQLGIKLEEIDGKFRPIKNDEERFLQMLNRRRYSVPIREDGTIEYYVANNRHRDSN